MTQRAVSSFDEELVRKISSSLNEPGWLMESRQEAYRQFVELPSEKNPLYTKYVSTFDFPLDPFTVVPGRAEVDFRSFFTGYLTGKEKNILLQGNETKVHAELEQELSSQGVSLTSLHEAVKSDEAQVRKLMELRLVKSGAD